MIDLEKLLESKENIGDIVHTGLSEASEILADNPEVEVVIAAVIELEDAVINVAVVRKYASFTGTPKRHNLRILK